MRARTLPRPASWIAVPVLLASLAAGGVVGAGTTEPAPPTDPVSASSSDPRESVPGGVVSEALDEDWFTPEGRVWSPISSVVDDEVHAALCDFLFGTPDEIADVFRIDSLYLVDGSGFVVLGGGGNGYRCKYAPGTATAATDPTATDVTATDDTATDDTAADEDPTVLEFVLWDTALTVDADTPGILEVFTLPPGDDPSAADQTTLLAIAEGFDGEMIDPEFAERWLTAARDRMA